MTTNSLSRVVRLSRSNSTVYTSFHSRLAVSSLQSIGSRRSFWKFPGPLNDDNSNSQSFMKHVHISFGGNNGMQFGNSNPDFGGSGGNVFQSMLEMCQESHARDIAQRMGLSVNHIKFKAVNDGDNRKKKMRAYIDAPNMDDRQLATLNAKVKQECPMAKFGSMLGKDTHIEWVKAET